MKSETLMEEISFTKSLTFATSTLIIWPDIFIEFNTRITKEEKEKQK